VAGAGLGARGAGQRQGVVTRRVVRILPEFFVLLDEQLPAERGPHGEPTVAEFAASDLLVIVDRFATRWDELPMPYLGRPDYRSLVVTTRLVPYVAVPAGSSLPWTGRSNSSTSSSDLHGLDPGPWARRCGQLTPRPSAARSSDPAHPYLYRPHVVKVRVWCL
jgi:hypothetical protein